MTHRILNLGAGVQSSTIYLMQLTGEVDFDMAVFADVGEEPDAVYKHLEWLKSLGGKPIHVVSQGKMGDDLVHGRRRDGSGYFAVSGEARKGSFASIPAYTAHRQGEPIGMVRRQCTSEYKIKPIERFIRREVLGLKPRQRIPKDTLVTQLYGISLDESGRAARIGKNNTCKFRALEFPLIDKSMTRRDCLSWIAAHGFPTPPRSACVFCPYKSDREWSLTRKDPAAWARAVEIDTALRAKGSLAKTNLEQSIYLHKSCRPLTEVQLTDEDRGQGDFWRECEGMCGN